MTRAEHKTFLAEHVAGGLLSRFIELRQALPPYIDDLQRDLGYDVYEQMKRDPGVEGPLETLRIGVLQDSWSVVAAKKMPRRWETPDPEAERAQELADFIVEALAGMETPLIDVAGEMLDALAYGHKIAEIVLEERGGGLVPKAIKPKDNRRLSFVVDRYFNVQGLINGAGVYGVVPDGAQVLPAWKFLVFTHDRANGDPRGQSILRQAYNFWHIKKEILPDFMKYLRQFASASVIGKLGPEAGRQMPKRDSDGAVVLDAAGDEVFVSAEQALLAVLLQFQNSTALALPFGTELDLLQSTGDGEAFIKAGDWLDRQMAVAILGTSQVNLEAQHESRSSKDVAQNVVTARMARIRAQFEETLHRAVTAPLVELNFGPEAVALAPRVRFAQTDDHDFTGELEAVAKAYASGYIHDSQLAELDQRLGLPPRDWEQIANERADSQMEDRIAKRVVDSRVPEDELEQ